MDKVKLKTLTVNKVYSWVVLRNHGIPVLIVSSESGYPHRVASISIVVLLPIPIMEAINVPPSG
jgi:hypothetical protein